MLLTIIIWSHIDFDGFRQSMSKHKEKKGVGIDRIDKDMINITKEGNDQRRIQIH